jgi:cytochrome c biogenesis protein CcmG, thiol:disulfide interchange protein DsbE
MPDSDDPPRSPDDPTPQPAAPSVVVPWSRRKLIGPFSARQVALVNAIVAASAVGLILVTRPLGTPNSNASVDLGTSFYQLTAATQGLALGQLAPELTGQDGGKVVQLFDLDGSVVSLAGLKGHPVWINFWATWCPPCQRETPVLRDASKAHVGDGLVLVAIDVQEDAASVREYAALYGLTYRIGLDVTGAVFHTYRIFGLPSQYFIDRNGVIRGRYFGPLTRDQVEQQLKAILQP